MLLPELLQTNFRLSPAKAAEVALLFREDRLEKGDYFLRRGQTVRKLSFLRSGHLRGWAPASDIYPKLNFLRTVKLSLKQVPLYR